MRTLLISLMALSALGSCTYSISMAHTEGTASDVIDEQQSPSAQLTAAIPAKL